MLCSVLSTVQNLLCSPFLLPLLLLLLLLLVTGVVYSLILCLKKLTQQEYRSSCANVLIPIMVMLVTPMYLLWSSVVVVVVVVVVAVVARFPESMLTALQYLMFVKMTRHVAEDNEFLFSTKRVCKIIFSTVVSGHKQRVRN